VTHARTLSSFTSLRASLLAACLFAAGLAATPAQAQQNFAQAAPQQPSPWTLLAERPAAVEAQPAWIRPVFGQVLFLNEPALRATLFAIPREGSGLPPTRLLLPDPSGMLQAFDVYEAPIMEPGLAAQFPDMRTFVGQGVDDPTATLRADITPQGFHAQVLAGEGDWYIDPSTKGDVNHYTSYFKRDLKQVHRWACEGVIAGAEQGDENAPNPGTFLSSGPTLRTFRLAVSATGEYTAFHGGTVALGQAAIVTAVNRVVGVYEREVTVRMVLVANNNLLVYTNASTDPFTNSSGGALLGQNQSTIDSVIGSANYDIGHVFSTGGGGVASLGSVCIGARKAQGVTGQPSPVGDPFTIDYVAHEMGHQFGANHCFNSTVCASQRNASTAFEPGSASTIMGYAGICGSDNLQSNSDAYFHSVSFDEIRNFVTGSTCGTSTATGNFAPTVSGGTNLAIPRNTPIILTATGSDSNGDPLTYCWEERALGPAAALSAADDGAIPLVRSLNPSTSAARFVPPLANVLANTVNAQQRLPQLGRTWNWRVTARDNRAGGGGINQADITLTVVGSAGPFVVTSPSSAVSWSAGSLRTITWNVAGTTASPINCANVNIDLSTDGGNTFPIVLATGVPNTGTASVTIPNNLTTNGRIRVRCASNIFYNVNQGGAITITPPVTGVVLTGTGSNTFTDNTGNGNNNARIEPGETAIRLFVPITNTGTSTATSVSGTLSSSTPTVSVTTPVATYANLPTNAIATNTAAYVINVSPSHPCGAPINLSLAISSTQGTGSYTFSLPTGAPGSINTTTFTYTGSAVAITDNNATGVNATLNVSGLTGTITDVDFRILGNSCNATAGSTSVGITHSYVGDLRARLTNPAGTTVTLFDRPGGTGNSGNNFCSTFLDDGGTSAIQAIAVAGAPFSSTFSPANPLSAFNGQNGNGTWTLNVADLAAQDTGTIRAFAIVIRTEQPPVCTPPNNAVCPSISQQPLPASGCVGDSVSFSALASGTPAPTYQWRKGGVPIVGNPSAGTSTLTIASITPGDAGSYSCLVSNSCGSIATNAVLLTVGGPNCSPCDPLDFNNDGLFPDDADLIDLLSVLAGAGCSTDPAPGCNDIDFNNDGLFPDDADLLAFLTVLAGGICE
jgi:subtilisin-like proprotein convertase family protein